MNPAQVVVARFGGQTALANLLGKTQSTIQHWSKTGMVPAKWHSTLLDLAAKNGVNLTASDLVAAPTNNTASDPAQQRKPPEAIASGVLSTPGEGEIQCFVLNDGRRVISRGGATHFLTNRKGGGNLESYIGTEAIRGYLPEDIQDQFVEFKMEGVVNRTVKGMTAETFLEICRAYVRARNEDALKSEAQIGIAIQASMFLAACANVGLIALIDEATGYQYQRPIDALRFKLKLYLEDEMRKWQKTFPDELWREFGRLTKWQGSLHSRPKYWGNLVMELVYGYLDPDVAEWLKENAPRPRHGENYHQWMSSQYGLKKLVEHIWMLVGMASACQSMSELRERMAQKFGRERVQFSLFLPPPTRLPGGKLRPDHEE